MSTVEYVLATSVWARMKGLLGTHCSLNTDEVLALIPCKSIHTYGMRFNIDVAFLDSEGMVLRTERNVHPNCMLSCKGAVITLERKSTENQSWFLPGDKLPFRAYG